MKELTTVINNLLRIPEASFKAGANHELYVSVPENQFKDAMFRVSRYVDLVGLFCVQDFEGYQGLTLFYAFEKTGHTPFAIFIRRLEGDKTSSVAKLFPSANWYEREIADGFGIGFEGSYDERHLFLHEVYPEGFHPLLKSVPNKPIATLKSIQPEDEYKFNELKGEGVYQIPVGPVHAGIIEPGHFRFSVIGETIFNLEIRMFYKHRGLEKLAEGKSPVDCIKIAESISGDESAVNAVGFCHAVEKISGVAPPHRAWELRTILLELERIYSHLGDMAGMVTDVAYPVGASRLMMMREEIFRQNQQLTGSRFFKDIVAIGGMKRDIPTASIGELLTYFKGFPGRFKEALDLVHHSPWVVDRFETTGVIKGSLVQLLHLTGPAGRGSGLAADNRLDHPYGIYPHTSINSCVLPKGDVLSRFEVKAAEILDSIRMIEEIAAKMKEGPVNCPVDIKNGYSISVLEAPRGQNMHWVYIKHGIVQRYKVRTASFCNWRAIEHAVLGNIVPDFPLINKSLNLSYAGTDL